MSKLGKMLTEKVASAAKSGLSSKLTPGGKAGAGEKTGFKDPKLKVGGTPDKGAAPIPGFTLGNFRSEINNESILQTSRHLMQFTLPRGLLSAHDPNDVRQVILRCDASYLPGVSFATSEEIRRYGVGPSERKPYLPIFGPISCSYIVDGEGVIHGFFYDWMTYIIGFDSSQGMISENAFGNNPYELTYKDDYSSTASIYVYNEMNDKIIEVSLNNAYPISVEAVPLSWGASDEYMKIQVTWEYTDWSAKYYSATSGAGEVSGIGRLRRDINKIAGASGPLGKISGLAKQLGVKDPVAGLIGRIGSSSQKITDIYKLVDGSKKTIVDSVKKRFGF